MIFILSLNCTINGEDNQLLQSYAVNTSACSKGKHSMYFIANILIQIAADEPPPKGCTLFFAVHGEKTCEFESLGKLLQTASERYLLNFET